MDLINRRLPNVIVPEDEGSWDLLYSGEEIKGDYYVLPIPKEDLRDLFKNGLFSAINAEFNILIDEQEEEEISGIEKLARLHQILDSYSSETEHPVLKYYYKKLTLLVAKAVESKTVVMFWF